MMTQDEQKARAKKAQNDYLTRLRRILEDEAEIMQELAEAISSKDDRRINDALAREKMFWHSVGSAEWHYHQDIKFLKQNQ